MSESEIQELTRRLHPVFKKYGVLRAILFGSLARGDASRRSDIDLIAVQDTDRRFLDRYEGFLREVVEASPGRDVDLLVYTPEELARMAQRPWIATVLKEGRTIYESGQESA
jgi:predicted nucleotidyltransferase